MDIRVGKMKRVKGIRVVTWEICAFIKAIQYYVKERLIRITRNKKRSVQRIPVLVFLKIVKKSINNSINFIHL